jgi:hypothetical protein
VFEYRVLRKIFGHKRVEVKGDWKTFCNENLHDLHCSPGIHIIKSGRTGWVWHVWGRGERCIQGFGGKL